VTRVDKLGDLSSQGKTLIIGEIFSRRSSGPHSDILGQFTVVQDDILITTDAD
jgi:hypothetical protein